MGEVERVFGAQDILNDSLAGVDRVQVDEIADRVFQISIESTGQVVLDHGATDEVLGMLEGIAVGVQIVQRHKKLFKNSKNLLTTAALFLYS